MRLVKFKSEKKKKRTEEQIQIYFRVAVVINNYCNFSILLDRSYPFHMKQSDDDTKLPKLLVTKKSS